MILLKSLIDDFDMIERFINIVYLIFEITSSFKYWSNNSLMQYGIVKTSRIDTVIQIKVQSLLGWGINTSYWARVTIGTESLSLGEGIFRNLSHDAKTAQELTWYVESPQDYGTIKMVFCRASSCDPPIEFDFFIAE